MFEHTYSQPDAPDPVLDEELVLSLVRRHVPDARVVTGIDESGGEARTYAVDEAIILKVQRPQQLRPLTSVEKEGFLPAAARTGTGRQRAARAGIRTGGARHRVQRADADAGESDAPCAAG